MYRFDAGKVELVDQKFAYQTKLILHEESIILFNIFTKLTVGEGHGLGLNKLRGISCCVATVFLRSSG